MAMDEEGERKESVFAHFVSSHFFHSSSSSPVWFLLGLRPRRQKNKEGRERRGQDPNGRKWKKRERWNLVPGSFFSPSSNPFLLPGKGETTTVYFSRKRKNKGIFPGFDEMGKIATCSPFFWWRLFVQFEATRTEAARKRAQASPCKGKG